MNLLSIFLNASFILLGFTAMVGNSFVLAIFGKYRKALGDCIDLIAILAVADLITGLGSVIAGMERFRVDIFQTNFTKAECLATTTPMIFGMTSGQIVLICICFDRLYATVKPLEYSTAAHDKFTMNTVAVTVAFSVVSVSCMYIGVDLTSKPVVCNAGASWTCAYRTYWALFTCGVGLVVICGYLSIIVTMHYKVIKASGPVAQQMKERQSQINKVVRLVLMGYIMFWVMPNMLYNLGTLVGVSSSIRGILGPLIGVGSGLNSSINVFIYALKHKKFRRSLAKVLGKSERNAQNVQIKAPNNVGRKHHRLAWVEKKQRAK